MGPLEPPDIGTETHALIFARTLLLLSTEPSLQPLKENQITYISVTVDRSCTLGFSINIHCVLCVSMTGPLEVLC